jgi:hypothetical protein
MLAYLFVYRDDLASGIRRLRREQLTDGKADDRRRLHEALQMLINACSGRSEKEANDCRTAAEKD